MSGYQREQWPALGRTRPWGRRASQWSELAADLQELFPNDASWEILPNQQAIVVDADRAHRDLITLLMVIAHTSQVTAMIRWTGNSEILENFRAELPTKGWGEFGSVQLPERTWRGRPSLGVFIRSGRTSSLVRDVDESDRVLTVASVMPTGRRRDTMLREFLAELANDNAVSAGTSTSEGHIESRKTKANRDTSGQSLPGRPPALWPGRKAGRPPANEGDLVVEFLRDTYGPYLPAHKDVLRDFIYEHDRTLYRAIQRYEETKTLPADVAITTRTVRVAERLRRAAEAGLNTLTQKERRSVTGKLLRSDRPGPK